MTATVRDLLAMKNSAVVYACPPEITVAEACRMMRDRRVGCLVVTRGSEVQGIVTERDVVARVVAEGRDPSSARVRDVMSRDVVTVSLEASCEEAEAILRARRIRHLPVVGARGLLGIVSLGDVAGFYAGRERWAAAGAGVAAR